MGFGKKFGLALFCLAFFAGSLSEASNRRLLHQGRILSPSGTPLQGNYQMEVKIYSPLPSRCLLWGEAKAVSFHNGVFNYEIGDHSQRMTGASAGSSINFTSVFINDPAYAVIGGSCENGTSYTPTSTDRRVMAITLFDGPLSIKAYEGDIVSVPYAIEASNASMVGGYPAENIFKFNLTSSHKPSLTFSTLGASFLWELAENGTFGNRVMTGLADPINPTDAVNLQSMNTAIAAAVTGGTVGALVTRVDAVSAQTGVLNVSGGPITSQGTFSFSFVSQSANTVFAAPLAGGVPSFRALAASDIPNLDMAKVTTGTLPVSRGGTGLGTYTPYALLTANMTGDAFEQRTCSLGDVLVWSASSGWVCEAKSTGIGSVTNIGFEASSLFSVTGAPITTSGTINLGLATQSQALVLASPTGASGTPTFRALASTDIPNLDVSKITSGTLGVNRGGTGLDATAAANGQILIGNGSGFSLGTLTAGSGIQISVAAGSIGISSTDPVGTSSQWQDNSNGIHYQSGSVGIGTNNPMANLDIRGGTDGATLALGTDAGPSGPGTLIKLWSYGDSAANTLQFNSSRGSTASPIATQQNDWLGIIQFLGYRGDYFPSGGARIVGIAEENISATNGGSGLILQTTEAGTTTSVDRFHFKGNGQFGIGVSQPSAALDIASNGTLGSAIRIPQDTSARRPASPGVGMMRYNTDLSKYEVYESTGWASLSTGSVGIGSQWVDNINGINYPSGSVGIGTSSPLGHLQIVGDGDIQVTVGPSASAGANAVLSLQGKGGGIPHEALITANWMGELQIKSAPGQSTIIYSESTPVLTVHENGNVGIGTQTPTAALDVVATGTLGSAIRIPRASQANRPVGSSHTDLQGMMRYNTDLNKYEVYEGTTGWVSLTTGSAGASQWTNVSRGISYASGSVGIGVAPTVALDILDPDYWSLSSTMGNVGIYTGAAMAADRGAMIALGGKVDGASTRTYATFAGRKENGTSGDDSGYYSLHVRNPADGMVERMRVSSTGHVGFGTASPTAKVHISANTDMGFIDSSNPGDRAILRITENGIGNLYLDGNSVYTNSPLNLGTLVNESIFLGTNAANQVEINGAGHVSVYKSMTVGGITATTGAILTLDGTGTMGSSLRLPRDTTGMRPAGLVGMIRYNTSSDKYEVYETTGWSDIATGTTGTSKWTVNTNGIHYSSGSVGVGTSTPTGRFHVLGTSSTSGRSIFELNTANNATVMAPVVLRATTSYATPAATVRTSLPFEFQTGDAAFTAPVQMSSIQSASETVSDPSNGFLSFHTLTSGTETEKLRITSTGNVGIGTSSPSRILSIVGTDSNIYTTSGTTATPFTNSTSPVIVAVGNNDPTIGTGSFIELSAKNTTRTGITYLGAISTDTNYKSEFVIGQRNGSASYAERLRISSDGNVGIGTSSPLSTLHVSSSISSPTSLSYNVSIDDNTTGSSINQGGGIALRGFTSSSSINTFGIIHGGKENSTGSNRAGYLSFATAEDISGVSTPSERMRISSTGNVGIGVTNPTYKLQLSTDSAAKPGTSTWTIASDERLKDIRAPFTRGLEAINGLDTIYFSYKKDNPLELPSDKEFVGIRAQEAQKLIPESVTTDKDGYLHVTNDSIIWTAVNAIKQLYSKVLGHDREIASLKEANELLKQDNAAMKEWICSKDPHATICK